MQTAAAPSLLAIMEDCSGRRLKTPYLYWENISGSGVSHRWQRGLCVSDLEVLLMLAGDFCGTAYYRANHAGKDLLDRTGIPKR